MINTTTLANLQDAIQLFDHYVGKDFLIVSQHSREKLPFVFQIRIRKQNFWHLLGCKLLVKEEDSDETIYEKCKNREDVSKAIGYVRSASESYLKYVVFKKLLILCAKRKR